MAKKSEVQSTGIVGTTLWLFGAFACIAAGAVDLSYGIQEDPINVRMCVVGVVALAVAAFTTAYCIRHCIRANR